MSCVAGYALELAQAITVAYHAERVQGGRIGFQYRMRLALDRLGMVMGILGMKSIPRV